jgi:hypothetical protein
MGAIEPDEVQFAVLDKVKSLYSDVAILGTQFCLYLSILIEFSLLPFFNTIVRGVTVIKAKKKRPKSSGQFFED